YIAPEVLEQGARAAAPSCDVWALGVVLHEGLSGAHPFARDTLAATVDEVLRAAPPPLPAGTPGHLVAACAAALQRDPGLRPTAAQLAALLLADEAAAQFGPGDETVELADPPERASGTGGAGRRATEAAEAAPDADAPVSPGDETVELADPPERAPHS